MQHATRGAIAYWPRLHAGLAAVSPFVVCCATGSSVSGTATLSVPPTATASTPSRFCAAGWASWARTFPLVLRLLKDEWRGERWTGILAAPFDELRASGALWLRASEVLRLRASGCVVWSERRSKPWTTSPSVRP